MAAKVVTDFAKTLMVFLTSSSLFQSPLQHSRDFSSLTVQRSNNPTAECLQRSSSIEELVSCFNKYTVGPEAYTQETYDKAQPSPFELWDWNDAISSLIDGSCDIDLPFIGDFYTISQFGDASGESFCVLSEITSNGTEYSKGWGLFITRASRSSVLRNIHLAAPHAGYDLGTPEQAAALFKSTGAKSLLIAGRSKIAFKQVTDCVPSTAKSTYYTTDPTHNKLEPFYEATKAIYENKDNGCPNGKCAFIHFHGKAASTCSNDDIFLSSGFGRDEDSSLWYGLRHPINILKGKLGTALPDRKISLPTDSSCSLTATKDVLGRLLNGVPDLEVCTKDAYASYETPGIFISAEQAPDLRTEEYYDAWTYALERTFPRGY